MYRAAPALIFEPECGVSRRGGTDSVAMTVYHLYLEEDSRGACIAHVPDLAGCLAAGENRQAALAAAPAAIGAYLRWCARHGEPLSEDGSVQIAVAEVQHAAGPWRRGSANALFAVDRAPLGDGELRTYLRRMGYARSDLIAFVRGLPSGSTNGAPGPVSPPHVRAAIEHLAETEAWYLSRLGQRITIEPTDDALQRLIDARARTVEAILRLSPRQRDLVYVPTERTSDDPEEGWTLRKVLRRCLEHEMTHLHHLLTSADVALSDP